MIEDPIYSEPTNESVVDHEQNPARSKKKIRRMARPPNLPLAASTPLRQN